MHCKAQLALVPIHTNFGMVLGDFDVIFGLH